MNEAIHKDWLNMYSTVFRIVCIHFGSAEIRKDLTQGESQRKEREVALQHLCAALPLGVEPLPHRRPAP